LIKSDSKYAIDCLSIWYKGWEKNGWKNSKKECVKNKEIIQDILGKMQKINVSFKHVRGHQSEPKDTKSPEWDDYYGNDQADIMANLGSLKSYDK
jgi:ribonuclease HI